MPQTNFEIENACPGCGNEPGDGVDTKCDHPEGCGFWKENE